METNPETTTGSTTTEPQPPTTTTTRSPRNNEVDKELLDAIQLAKDVLRAANDPVNAAIYDKELAPADVALLPPLLTTADETLVPAVINAKKAALGPTELEEALRQQLVGKLRWIQGQASRTYAQKSKRAAYLINKPNFGRNREVLTADAMAILNLAKTDTLKKVNAETDLPPIVQLVEDWSAADREQKRLQNAVSTAVEALRAAVAGINAIRRDIQKAADLAFPHTDRANEPERRAFKIQVSRRYNLRGGGL